jgi:hypothetical protein
MGNRNSFRYMVNILRNGNRYAVYTVGNRKSSRHTRKQERSKYVLNTLGNRNGSRYVLNTLGNRNGSRYVLNTLGNRNRSKDVLDTLGNRKSSRHPGK